MSNQGHPYPGVYQPGQTFPPGSYVYVYGAPPNFNGIPQGNYGQQPQYGAPPQYGPYSNYGASPQYGSQPVRYMGQPQSGYRQGGDSMSGFGWGALMASLLCCCCFADDVLDNDCNGCNR